MNRDEILDLPRSLYNGIDAGTDISTSGEAGQARKNHGKRIYGGRAAGAAFNAQPRTMLPCMQALDSAAGPATGTAQPGRFEKGTLPPRRVRMR